jgi:beta-N-acetylhexosaminidase
MNKFAFAVWGVAALFLAGASSPSLAQDKKADINGVITKASVSNDAKKVTLGSILVEGKVEKDTSYDKASITILKTTKLEKQVGKEIMPATFADLKVGAKVIATFSGPVAESYPVQARAGVVLILPADEKK